MKSPLIAFYDSKVYEIDFFKKEAERTGIEFKYYNNRLDCDTVTMSKGFDGICVFVNDDLSEEVISFLAGCNIRLIALRCAGYNNVDLKAAYKKVHVVRVPSYSPYAVAEHALALILTLNRKTHKAYYRIRDNNFNINGFLGFDLKEKTIGVIGTGTIGKAFVHLLNGFGMKILAYDIFPDEEFARQHNLQYVELHDLFRQSDIISLHCPLTLENIYMINSESIKLMKEGVMLINTGRGKLINTKDLIQGLKSGKVGYAGLDVYEEETDYFFEDFSSSFIEDDVLARLLTFPNVLITSHQGYFTKEALSKIASVTCNNIISFFNEDSLPNEICYRCGNQECEHKKSGRCF
jgi:D-lactate dehydrogenase